MAIGQTRAIALAKMYKTPPVPQSDAAIVATPVAGQFVPVAIGAAFKMAPANPPPPRGTGAATAPRGCCGWRVDDDGANGIVAEEKPYTTWLKRATKYNVNEDLILTTTMVDGTVYTIPHKTLDRECRVAPEENENSATQDWIFWIFIMRFNTSHTRVNGFLNDS